MAGSSPDWRMRSASDEVRDNRTRTERGPLGAGGENAAEGPHTEAAYPLWWACSTRGGANAGTERGHGGVGLNPGGPAEGSAPN